MTRGFAVYRAMSPNAPCDLVILREAGILKIEVRAGYVKMGGGVHFRTRAGDHSKSDHFAIATKDKIIYVPELPT
jgi:hypothetical protein